MVSNGSLSIELGYAGACPKTPTLTIKIYDDSASLLGGADSTGLRYTESAMAIEHVRRRCRCDRELIAILHMNRPTSADRPPMRLNRRYREDVDGGLVIPSDGDGASTLGGTLERAGIMAEAHPQHQITLVVFSDWELTDDIRVLTKSLVEFPGSVYAVSMRAAVPSPFVEEKAITTIEVPSGEEPGAVARALFDAMTLHRPGRSRR